MSLENVSATGEVGLLPLAVALIGSGGKTGSSKVDRFTFEKKELGRSFLMILPTYEEAANMASDLSFFVEGKIHLLYEENQVLLPYESKSKGGIYSYLKAIDDILRGEEVVLISTPESAFMKFPKREIYEELILNIRVGDDVDFEGLPRRLLDMGYERVPMVYARGQFSVRGDIVDIFTPYDENPWRIEVWDTVVESIRTFYLESQRSIEEYQSLRICIGDKITVEDIDCGTFVWEYMDTPSILLGDGERIDGAVLEREDAIKRDFGILLDEGKVVEKDMHAFSILEGYKALRDFDELTITYPHERITEDDVNDNNCGNDVNVGSLLGTNVSRILNSNGRLDVFEGEIRRYSENSYWINVVCSSDKKIESMVEILEGFEVGGNIAVKKGHLSRGFDLPDAKVCYITEGEIFGVRKQSVGLKKKKRRGDEKAIKSFSHISKGDYVVHEMYGIGKFIGIEQIFSQNVKKDFLKIQYAGSDVLYVPVEQSDGIQKYLGKDAEKIKVSKMGGKQWKQKKSKARAAVADMAVDLLNISAERMTRKGYQFSPDTVWQSEFEDSFPFEETQDQLRSIEEIKADMESALPMDRLLCGDVGFGKTEVAARALFKCVSDGKQAAVLVPTTILASQHYETLNKRFEKFPFSVDVISRFRSREEQQKTIKELKSGRLDLIIGTHRLLSEDVVFKDLGLLVVDEEQRFGVKNKEKIKQLKNNIDILTLSATPIPRTLHMSLIGLRSMSLIEEAPEERYPVQTYVVEEEDYLIKDVIEREIGRGGQVFVVSNRVQGIYRVAERIKNMIPEREVVVGHGQMNERVLEKVMKRFADGEADVIVSTTIIESGIDISNVNTMIILNADKFGLSQLYQLRGRVGRSNKPAFAYLMHKKNGVLSESSRKRLSAIKDFTELGAGFKLSMRDLEIRGGGDILGAQQHGHMLNVGYELYCKMVEETVRQLQGKSLPSKKEEATIEIMTSAYIPNEYIVDEDTKLEVYKNIAMISQGSDVLDTLQEMKDRFGKVPKEVENLIKISHLKSMAEDLGILKIKSASDKLLLYYPTNVSPKPVKLFLEGDDNLEEIYEIVESMCRRKEEN